MASISANVPTSPSLAGIRVSEAERSYALKVMRSPLYQRLQAAGLIGCSESDICEWIQEWQQIGGSFSNFFAEKACLPIQTMQFFFQEEPVSNGQRIGDYLVAAGLVTRLAIRQVLDELKTSGRKQLLGQALAERQHISRHTANYFANRFTKPDRAPASSPDPSFSSCMTNTGPKTLRYKLDEFLSVVADAATHSRVISPSLRQEAAKMLAAYPNHCKLKYWCARLGVTNSKNSVG